MASGLSFLVGLPMDVVLCLPQNMAQGPAVQQQTMLLVQLRAVLSASRQGLSRVSVLMEPGQRSLVKHPAAAWPSLLLPKGLALVA